MELYTPQIGSPHAIERQVKTAELFETLTKNALPTEQTRMPIISGYKVIQRKNCTCNLAEKPLKRNLLKHIIRTHPLPQNISVNFYYCINHNDVPLVFDSVTIDHHVKKNLSSDCAVGRDTFYYDGTSWKLMPTKKTTPLEDIVEGSINRRNREQPLESQTEVVSSKKRSASSREKSPKKSRVEENLHETETNMTVVHELFPEAILPSAPASEFETSLS